MISNRPERPRPILGLAAALALALIGAGADESPPDVTEPPPYGEFLVIPLRVHILTAGADLPEVDCRLTDADIRRILGKVNRIWHPAGIHFGLESLCRESAAQQGRFRVARDLEGTAPVRLFRILLPEPSRRFDGLHVYYVHRFAVNGIYMGEDFALVQETARLRPVEGGIDEPIPRVTAHELGHALGLRHRQDRTNLLASGTTGTRLNAAEVATARRRAKAIPGTATVEELIRAAEETSSRGDRATARRLWTWLSEIPGDEAEEARRRLD
ncbi:MAG: matrixin family metalloprotease [Isosphaeraceae bacterium]|nr:matrixin family metalloprotease [Isosphaeraceae bacterium]